MSKQANVEVHNEIDVTDLDYDSYLRIAELKNLQKRRTTEHDEHLFIVIHQVYELWFKEVDFEISSVLDLMKDLHRIEDKMLTVLSRLQRVIVVLKILVDQIRVLETMTPLDFLDFRHELGSGTGFQSFQFHLIEVKLGLRQADRVGHGKLCRTQYTETHSDFRSDLEKAESPGPSLFDLVERWLETNASDSFWQTYCKGVDDYLKEEKARLDFENEKHMKKFETLESSFEDIKRESRYSAKKVKLLQESTNTNGETKFDEKGETQREIVEKPMFRLSHKAAQGAIRIIQNRDDRQFHTSYQLLSLLMDVDSLLMHWRNNHSLFVHRMIGSKMGTGGSGGYEYLRKTVASETYRIYSDLFKLSSFLVPRRCIGDAES
ncbi:tryptophan 2,3-dioxygenase-like [Corticium candelabrum]|uniref:tryptophan 2,3-dioxygenase-like n=1 Tax=Corticium candelabrum TaxID=121492 RepID=UPI002E255965|nr:tryptophan 2,3-dioxygenase-like [Corticium candelabrum]